jgi:hypothetical protein
MSPGVWHYIPPKVTPPLPSETPDLVKLGNPSSQLAEPNVSLIQERPFTAEGILSVMAWLHHLTSSGDDWYRRMLTLERAFLGP